MGSGPWRPGQRPARGFHPPERPQAFVSAPLPPVTAGALLRRGYNASRHPSKRFRFPQRPKAYVAYGGGGGEIQAFGAAGAGTLVLALETGTKTSYSWSTDITRTHSGLEMRSSPFPHARRRFEGAAFLVDSSSRDARGTLMRAAAAGSTFLLACRHEELLIAADSLATTVTVTSTAVADWAQVGQRIVIIGVDSTVVYAVIQAVTATTFTVVVSTAAGALLFVPIGSAGHAGALVMPLVQILLDAQQGFSRYAVGVDMWSVRASASVFGWCGADVMGAGATITTYTQGVPIAVANVIDADLIIWDRPNAINGTADDALLSGAEPLDLGALPTGFGDLTVASWERPILYSSSSLADLQWIKAFLHLCRGRQRAFLLSTNRDDLIYVGLATGGIKVQSSSVTGGGDYASWWQSAAHRRLAFTMTDGSIVYATVINQPTDNGDGTLTLPLDSGPGVGVVKVSLAEQVRFDMQDSDELPVTWDGGVFSFEATARAVQDIIVPPVLPMYDTVIRLAYAYVFPAVPPSDQEFACAIGSVTLLNVTTDRTLNFGGISSSVAPVDGSVVTIKCVNNNAFGVTLNHEDTAFAAADRFLMLNQASSGNTNQEKTYAYNTSIQRWVQIA